MMALWMGLPQWARTALMWIGALFMMALTGKFLLSQHDKRIRREVNDARDIEAAQVESEVLTQITDNTNEVVREADAVRSHTAVVELPDGTKSLPKYHFRD
jgi:branched-subunit amino acid transport protein